jgi:UDP-galactopyranose mutase
LLDDFLAAEEQPLIRWYYTPMMLPFSRHLASTATVYDCMDELANFRFAPPQLLALEQELFASADVVFTGGYSLYEAKKDRHPNIHPFPSSVDRAHFGKARATDAAPDDQTYLPGPRLGFYGVIDERMDLELIGALADAHPEWSIVMVGPIVKIDHADLPQRANIHYLGRREIPEVSCRTISAAGTWLDALRDQLDRTMFISPTRLRNIWAGRLPSSPLRLLKSEAPLRRSQRRVLRGRHRSLRRGLRTGVSRWPRVGRMACRRGCQARHLSGARLCPVWQGLVRRHWMCRRWPRCRHQRREEEVRLSGRRRSGFAGSVLAERLATQHDAPNPRELVVDKRPHIAG